MPQVITSADNPLVKDLRRAIARGGLTAGGCWVAETPHLLEEALRSGADVQRVVVASSAAERMQALFDGLPSTALADSLFQTVAATETSQGLIALVRPPEWTLEELFPASAGPLAERRALIVVLDEIQDPGNAGAIVRAAEAFGASGVIFIKGTASPHNPKTLRASAGSLFRLPVAHGLEPECARAALVERGVRIFATVPAHAGSLSIADADFATDCALIIGNEARGVSAAWREQLGAPDHLRVPEHIGYKEQWGAREISIPTAGVESLNAAVAAGIVLYEARRQRDG